MERLKSMPVISMSRFVSVENYQRSRQHRFKDVYAVQRFLHRHLYELIDLKAVEWVGTKPMIDAEVFDKFVDEEGKRSPAGTAVDRANAFLEPPLLYDCLENLRRPQEYQAERTHVFPSVASLMRYVANHRDSLIIRGAILWIHNRWCFDAPKMDSFVLKAGDSAACDRFCD